MSAIDLSYDRGADVLYVRTCDHRGAYGEEGAPGIIWKYANQDDALVGATVMDYATYWRPRMTELVREMASHFHIAEDSAKEALDQISAE